MVKAEKVIGANTENCKTSIVIVTNNDNKYIQLCIDSIRLFTKNNYYELIVVDNHSNDGTVDYLGQQSDIKLILNDEDMGFSFACNQGISESSFDNVLLLDADTVVTQNWLSNLIVCIESSPEIGIVGPVTNLGAQGQVIKASYNSINELFSFTSSYNISCKSKWLSVLKLSSFCLLIKKDILLKTGNLDKQFTNKNYADSDLSLRILQSGFKLLLCGDTYIYHYNCSVGETENITGSAAQCKNNISKFKIKWGFNPDALYSGRNDIVKLIEENSNAHLNILHLGCSCGATLKLIHNTFKNASLYGIETNAAAAKIASLFASVQIRSCEDKDLGYQEGFFDYIICTGVLQRIFDPWNLLKRLRKLLKPTGFILLSLPNTMNYQIIKKLFNGRWDFTDIGESCSEQIRFFTPKTIYEMLNQAGYSNPVLRYKPLEIDNKDEDFINRLCKMSDSSMNTLYKATNIVAKAAATRQKSDYDYVKKYEYDQSEDGLLIYEKNKKPSKQMLSKVLLVYDLHEDLNRNNNLSVLKGLLVDPIRNTGFFKEIIHLHREAMYENGTEKWTNELLRACKTQKPNLLIFHIPFMYDETVAQALIYIRDELKIPVLGFTTDLITMLGGSYMAVKQCYDKYIACSTKTVSIDTSNPNGHYSGDFIIGFSLVNYQLFNPSLSEKDIDVSFTGSIAQWAANGNTSRRDYIDYLTPRLEKSGIKFSFIDSSGRGAPLEEYAGIMNRSKMVINFSQATAGNKHMKGRVFEVLGSGAMLLEEENADTRCFFDAFKDYVEFSDPEDLFNKIRYYNNNSIEREKIAASGHEKAVHQFTEDTLIRYILEQLGLIPKVSEPDSNYHFFTDRIDDIKKGF